MKKSKEHPNYVPHPFRRPGPGADGTRTTDIKPDINLRVFNFASKSCPSREFDWKDIQAIAISDSGESGTIFVEGEKGSVVVKGSPNVAVSTFFNYIGELLMVPQCSRRIVRYDEPEFKLITKELQRATFLYSDLYQRVRSRLDRPFLEILDYIPGITVTEMGPKRAQKILNYYDPKSRHRMIRIGMIYGLDLLLDNGERLPLSVWNNKGDPEHILAKTEPTYLDTTRELRDINNLSFEYELIYALDHRHTFVDELEPYLKQQHLQRYYVRTEEFLNGLFVEMKSVMHAQLDPLYETKEQKLETMQAFKDFIQTHTLWEMKEMTILQVMIGLILTLDNLVEIGPLNLQAVYQSVHIENDYRDHWNSNLARLNMDFFGCMISIFKKFIGIHMDVVRWCRDVTLGQYSYNQNLLDEILCRNPTVRKQRELEKALLQQQKEEELMRPPTNDNEPKEQADNPEDEILEEELDDESLNKKIKDLFYVDLKQLKADLKQDMQNESQVPVPVQPQAQQQPQQQPQPVPQEQVQQPPPQPTNGGMLAKKKGK